MPWPIGLACALAHHFPEVPLFDHATLPAHVRDELAIVGYWVCTPDLRDRLTRWDDLDEPDARVAENDLRLMGAVLAR